MATRDEVKAMIGYMIMAFSNYHPDVTSTPNTIDVMCDLLGDLSAETLTVSVKTCCSEPGRAFAPSAGEIRGAAVRLHVKASGVPQPGEAWQEVMDTMVLRSCHDGTPEYSHPLIKKAVQAIGIVNIGMSEDPMIERAHFLKIYASYLEREKDDAALIPQATDYIEAQKRIGAGINALVDKFAVKRLGAG